jgi:hypothetical protein
MAKAVEKYEAKNLELRPSNTGYSAAEQAGRRIGPFATQAANAIRQVAALSAKNIEDQGQQQTAFARLAGLEAQQREASKGIATKFGGGLKDMFQLGAGGNEPNYARLNRLAELSEAPVNIARTARRIVNAQSPLTNTVENGVSVLRGGGSDQSDVENGVTVLRGGGGQPAPAPDAFANDPTVRLLGSPVQKPQDLLGNTNQISGGPPGFGEGTEGPGGRTYNQFNQSLAPIPVTGGGPDKATWQAAESNGTNTQQWPTPTALAPPPGAVANPNNGDPSRYGSGEGGQMIPVNNAPGYAPSPVSAPTDPSQNPDAPPVWGDLMGGF